MGRVFVVRRFGRWAEDEDLADAALLDTIEAADAGTIAANLGGGLVKLRIAREGGGKSGGYRTIVAFKKGDKAFYLEGFAKNVSDNISPKDEKRLKAEGKVWQGLSDQALEKALAAGTVREIERGQQNDG